MSKASKKNREDDSSKVIAQHVVDLHKVIGDRYFVGVFADSHLNPIILSTKDKPDYRTLVTGEASFPIPESTALNEFRIHYSLEEQWFSIDLKPTSENYHHVQPLGNNEWLLVRGRSRSDKDLNAHVYNSYGKPAHSFAAGDGIEDVQVTANSEIWISYFDEGVYGNTVLGQSGLNCFNEHGKRIYDFRSAIRSEKHIDDCYALNVVSNHDTWVYYYSSFPVVKISNRKEVTNWSRIPVKGSHCFAVTKDYLIFGGSYKKKNILFQVELTTNKVHEFLPVLDDGTVLDDIYSFARAHQLFLVTEKSLYTIDARCF